MAKAARKDLSDNNSRSPDVEVASNQGNQISETALTFRNLWNITTDDNPLTLYGFRRFRTTHLLNLRLLETEIDTIDHKIYQAGLGLDLPLTSADKLGLKHSKRDEHAPSPEEIFNPELVSRLRQLLKEYGTLLHWKELGVPRLMQHCIADEALASFNQIMMMETFALADNSWQATLRSDNQNPYELYKTRLVRVDTVGRSRSGDLLRRTLRKFLRAFWFFVRFRGQHAHQKHSSYFSATELESNLKRSYQNTNSLADILTRFLIALIAGIYLVIPLVILSHQSTTEAHLVTISVFIVMFSLLISCLTRATNEETMVASAAYAAVLSVFFSNNSVS